jgi:hypothetical protein
LSLQQAQRAAASSGGTDGVSDDQLARATDEQLARIEAGEPADVVLRS